MTTVKTTRIDNFICPACGETMGQVIAVDGVVKGWCTKAKKEIKWLVPVACTEEKEPEKQTPLCYMDELQQKRAMILKDLVSAREDGDLKENSAYHSAKDQLTIIDYKIAVEEKKLRELNEKK